VVVDPFDAEFRKLIIDEIGGPFVYKTMDNLAYIIATGKNIIDANILLPHDFRNAILYYISEHVGMSQKLDESSEKAFSSLTKDDYGKEFVQYIWV
jgi:hypothetical protein